MEDRQELEALAAFKRSLWAQPEAAMLSFGAAPPERRIVAEGDSWFDYPFAKDVLDHLKHRHRYEIIKVAKAGDTLENMAYGLGFPNQRPLEETLHAVARFRPKWLLLSGGGNDVAGDEFAAFLNHQASGLPLLRQDHAKSIITEMARSAFVRILERAWDRDHELHILAHGYAYAVPTGIGALRLFGWTFVGPWLRPALLDKNIDPDQQGRPIVRELIDSFNAMLSELDATYERFHYVDVRALVGEADWRDELHPTSEGFGRVADAIRERMTEINVG